MIYWKRNTQFSKLIKIPLRQNGHSFQCLVPQNVKFFSGSRGTHGPIYHRPSGENFSFARHTLPDDGRSVSQNLAGKHYDSRHDKLRKQEDQAY